MSEVDLDAIEVKWLQQCPSCDAGIPSECTHPHDVGDDYRIVMSALVDEVRMLREASGDPQHTLPYATSSTHGMERRSGGGVMVDLTKRHVPAWFGSWMLDHYEFNRNGAFCLRCGMETWGLTKHARNSHGDDIEDLPPSPSWAAQGIYSDLHGRKRYRPYPSSSRVA